MEDIEKEYFGEKKVETLTEIYDEIEKTVKRLDELVKLSEKNAKENYANLLIIQKLLSANYNMLLGISSETPKQEKYVEAGMYDKLPERLSEILEEMLRVILE